MGGGGAINGVHANGLHVDDDTVNANYVAGFVNDNSGVGQGILVKAGSSASYVTADFQEYQGNSLFYVQGNGNIGIGTTNPKSALQNDTPDDATTKYMQIDARATAPDAGDCDNDEEMGRMIYESVSKWLWICDGAGGWRRVATTT